MIMNAKPVTNQVFIQVLLSAAIFLPKAQFLYYLLSSVAPWSCAMVDTKRKVFEN